MLYFQSAWFWIHEKGNTIIIIFWPVYTRYYLNWESPYLLDCNLWYEYIVNMKQMEIKSYGEVHLSKFAIHKKVGR